MIKIFKIAVIITCLLMVSCASTRTLFKLDTQVELQLIAASDMNPDADGRASPISLTIYHLKKDRAFQQADFIALYENSETVLGKDLLAKVILQTLVPSTERAETLLIQNEVNYLGVVAEYARYEEAKTKILLPIKLHQKHQYQVLVDRLGLVLSSDAIR